MTLSSTPTSGSCRCGTVVGSQDVVARRCGVTNLGESVKFLADDWPKLSGLRKFQSQHSNAGHQYNDINASAISNLQPLSNRIIYSESDPIHAVLCGTTFVNCLTASLLQFKYNIIPWITSTISHCQRLCTLYSQAEAGSVCDNRRWFVSRSIAGRPDT
jgi:hypothetical protein